MSRADLFQQVSVAVAEWQDAVQSFDESAADVLGVNLTDQRCLGALYRSGPLTAGRLAAITGLTTGAQTAALDRLEAAGYVRRRRDTEDRRRVLAELTSLARRRIADIWAPVERDAMAELRHFEADALRAILEFLRLGTVLQHRHASRLKRQLLRAAAPSGTQRGGGTA